MARKISTLPRDLNGKTFETDEGKRFVIVTGDHFSERTIGKQHRKYLSGLKTGLLVSVTFYGQPVPLVVVDDGVVRLVEVKAGRETFKGSAAISKRLGVEETRQPIGLFAA